MKFNLKELIYLFSCLYHIIEKKRGWFCSDAVADVVGVHWPGQGHRREWEEVEEVRGE